MSDFIFARKVRFFYRTKCQSLYFVRNALCTNFCSTELKVFNFSEPQRLSFFSALCVFSEYHLIKGSSRWVSWHGAPSYIFGTLKFMRS